MAAQVIEVRRPHRQDTFDLRNDIVPDDNRSHAPQAEGNPDEDHSVLDDDSSNEDGGNEDYIDDDDGTSSLSIPNESIDFDLVYSLHNFAATVEGQASVVKGDSLFLMDDSNSYWWLVRVLTTQEVGYIPAENIETPFERLARLNKHRNVDLASATQEELQENVQTSRDRMRGVISPRHDQRTSPNGAGERKTVVFTGSSVYNYPPAVWGDEEMDEDGDWDEDDGDYGYYEEEDEEALNQTGASDGMEPDDGMSWESTVVEEERTRGIVASVPASPASPAVTSPAAAIVPDTLRPAGRQPPPSPIATSPQQSMGLASTLRHQTSRERLQASESPAQASPATPMTPMTPTAPGTPVNATPQARMFVDPAAAGETRKLTATPSIAREAARQSLLQQESAKRAREEAAAEEESARKKKSKELVQPVSPASVNRMSGDPSKGTLMSGGKLRKGRESPAQEEESGKEKKKKSGVFGGLFGRKKDKSKDKMSEGVEGARTSEDSTFSGSTHGQYTASPPETGAPLTSSAPPRARDPRTSTDSRRSNAGSTPTPGQAPHSFSQFPPPAVSQHSLKMQQIDQQQQALYQQYLKSSPASHPEGPSYGLQSASTVMPNSNSGLTPGFRTQGGRPGSLILSPTGLEGPGVPELSVIRVFAGPDLHTEATFKTVLLNASTTSSDLIRQAMQRFRLAAGEDAADYYLEIKQVEGSSAVLLPHERPLGVFENLVEASQLEVPRVKRSSMGSISSVSSTLSMHPAIKKLSMNDFTDDSAVKFYLNRRTPADADASGDDGEDTIRLPVSEVPENVSIGSPVKSSLTISTASGSNVTPERFSSPSSRFALQVFILPDDLPDGMVFDPHTEAIVPKSTLRDRSQVNAAASSGVSQTQRRKVLQFPKNTTVAEVIELALERFGIAEGVVDGGDEIEDKLAKRISLARVRYGLAVQAEGQERHLQPSSKILDAFTRPPILKAVERRSGEKRRSVDSAMLLGSGEDVRPDDPMFILRRAVGFRLTGKSRMSAPLDEIALQHLQHQRDSTSDDGKSQQQRQELIAAQRAASRATQRALLSAQTNSERGVDVMLPGNAMLRSSLHEAGDKMRYSYVQDGETFDISDIVEEEQRGASKRDWLEGVVARNQEGLGDNFDRVLSRIKGNNNKPKSALAALASPGLTEDTQRSSMSSYSVGGGEPEKPPPPAAVEPSSRTATPSAATARGGSATPTDREKAGSKAGTARQPSEDSTHEAGSRAATATPRRGPLVVKDDFGVANMIAVIELGAARARAPPPPPLDHVDELLFGCRVDVGALHPWAREMFEGTFRQLDDMDRQLDRALAATSRAF